MSGEVFAGIGQGLELGTRDVPRQAGFRAQRKFQAEEAEKQRTFQKEQAAIADVNGLANTLINSLLAAKIGAQNARLELQSNLILEAEKLRQQDFLNMRQSVTELVQAAVFDELGQEGFSEDFIENAVAAFEGAWQKMAIVSGKSMANPSPANIQALDKLFVQYENSLQGTIQEVVDIKNSDVGPDAKRTQLLRVFGDMGATAENLFGPGVKSLSKIPTSFAEPPPTDPDALPAGAGADDVPQPGGPETDQPDVVDEPIDLSPPTGKTPERQLKNSLRHLGPEDEAMARSALGKEGGLTSLNKKRRLRGQPPLVNINGNIVSADIISIDGLRQAMDASGIEHEQFSDDDLRRELYKINDFGEFGLFSDQPTAPLAEHVGSGLAESRLTLGDKLNRKADRASRAAIGALGKADKLGAAIFQRGKTINKAISRQFERDPQPRLQSVDPSFARPGAPITPDDFPEISPLVGQTRTPSPQEIQIANILQALFGGR